MALGPATRVSGAERRADVLARQSEEKAKLAEVEGVFAGVSSGGACHAALELDAELSGATIVFIVCDRGDRYISTGVFPAE